MSSLTFNGNLLTPNGIIRCDKETFVNTFVVSKGMAKRNKIYAAYELYWQHLQSILNGVSFTHWIDGSFITNKTNPNDIDVLTFLLEEDYLKLEKLLQPFTYPTVQTLYEQLVDAYIVPLKTDNIAYWSNHFETVTKHRMPIRGQKKGFLELVF